MRELEAGFEGERAEEKERGKGEGSGSGSRSRRSRSRDAGTEWGREFERGAKYYASPGRV